VRPPVRVEIVSDSHIVREGLVGLVAALGEAAIVVDDVSNDAENGDSTKRDVTLLDLGAVDGLAAYERLRNTCRRGVPVIGLVYDTEGPGPRQPHCNPTDHLHTITLSVTPAELGDLLEQVVDARSPRHDCTNELPCELTEREYEVISMIGQGLSNQQIAHHLFVSINSVKTYIRSAYRKLHVTSRPQAILWAMEHGLVARPTHDDC
jgi:DNA-binding NarL/FixJ family response regulator